MRKTFLKIFTSLLILSFFAIPNGFVFAEDIVPQITDVTPSEIRFGDGQDLIINGNNFSDIPGEIITEGSLDLNGRGVSAVEWSDSRIRVSNADLARYFYDVDTITNIELKTYYQLENRWVYPTKNVSVKLLPRCYEDTWTCTESCTKTFDCPGVDTPSPEPPKPVVDTARYAPNYHYFVDLDDNNFYIGGSGFGDSQGKIINLDKNNAELLIETWSDTYIKMSSINDNGTVLVGPNRIILHTSVGIDSDPFTITFGKYWIGPNILSISPTTIHLGDQVEITGENFGDNPPSPCPVISNDPNGVWCGLVDGSNRPQTVISWSNTKIIAHIDNTDVGTHRGIRVVAHSFISNDDRTREGKNGYIDILAPSCISDTWSCGDWNTCSIYGSQTRTCNKTFDCPTATTPSPATTQSCTPPQPACSIDIWTCGAWGSCSLSGIQNRSCTKTFDCPDVQTAPPITDQYCEPPSRSTPQTPPSGTDEILNQDSIIKSTVKLLCPVNAQMASQGSGTVIDPSGIILTNKHVIAGTLGCLVGFINDFNDEPYFGERQIADISKVSSNQDIAILKIRNPQNKRLTSVDITKGNSNLRLGTKITIYGYPAKFGTKITYTSGDFSGTDGSYLKTTAILEYGNSGGGAYLKDGTFIGIPSAVVKGELNALGYLLSINTINSWLGNSSMAYGGTSNNNYSRVSILEDIDLNKLGSLKLFIPDTDAKGNLSASAKNQNSQNIKEQPQSNQAQKESIIIEPTDKNQKINSEQNNPVPSEKEQKPKVSWLKRLFLWFKNLF